MFSGTSIDVLHTMVRVMLHIIPCPHFVPSKLMWLLKLLFDQNSIVIYHKFNGDFKSHVNFKET